MYKNILRFIMLSALALSTVSLPTHKAYASPTAQKIISLSSGNMQYIEAGSGSTLLVLLHGFPETNHEWHAVTPLLAKDYKVVSINLPGIGKSDPLPRFDKRSIAESIFQFVNMLNPHKVVVIGHDIGGMVAYAYARKYPNRADALVIIDVPVPGLDPWDEIKNSAHAWHFGFHQLPITEKILKGREKIYLENFYERVSRNFEMPKHSQELYIKAYQNSKSLTTAMGWYRAFSEDENANKADLSKPMRLPVLLLSNDWAGKDRPMIAHRISDTQETVFIEGAGHWLPEEKPVEVSEHIDGFLKRHGLAKTK